MTSREQFESWLEGVHGLYGEDVEWQPERNCYAKFGIHLAWCAWQASRSSIELNLTSEWDISSDGSRHYDADSVDEQLLAAVNFARFTASMNFPTGIVLRISARIAPCNILSSP